MNESSALKPPRRAALIFILITVLLDVLALGIIIPVLPQLISEFLDGDVGRAAEMIGLFGTVWALMQFLVSPVLGILSDRFGRRPVILLSNFGLGIDYIFMALAPSLSLLFIGRVVSGITSASIPAAGGYIADVTTPEQRSAGFGMLGMAFGIGFILGPALGGLLGESNPRLPFVAAAGLSLLNTIYGIFVLPESLAKENRTPFMWKKANPIGSMHLLRSHPELSRLALVNFLITLAHVVLPTIFVLYAYEKYGWSTREVGLTLAFVGLTSGIVQGALVGPVIKRWGEQRILLAGLVFGVIGFSVFGWAPSGSLFWIGVPFMALWGLAGAAIQGLMSQHVGANEQGQLQGATGCIRGIAEMLGPVLFTATFAYFISLKGAWKIAGAPFFISALLMLGAILIEVVRMTGSIARDKQGKL